MPPKKTASGAAGGKRGRSAVTGRFVRQATVQRHPNTTVNEQTTRRKSGKSR